MKKYNLIELKIIDREEGLLELIVVRGNKNPRHSALVMVSHERHHHCTYCPYSFRCGRECINSLLEDIPQVKNKISELYGYQVFVLNPIKKWQKFRPSQKP